MITQEAKMYLFEITTFFAALYFSNQLNFISDNSNVKHSCFWFLIKYFFLLCNCCYDKLKQTLFSPIFIATIVKNTNYFSTPIPQCLWLPNLADGKLPWLAPTHNVIQPFDWSGKVTWQIKTIKCLTTCQSV